MVRPVNRRHDKGIGHIDTKETEAVFRAEFWALRHDFISKRTTKDELPAGIGESPLFRHMEPSADVPAWWRYAAVGFVVERLAAGEPSETNTTVLADQSPRSRGRRIRWDDVALEAAVAEPAAAQEAALNRL